LLLGGIGQKQRDLERAAQPLTFAVRAPQPRRPVSFPEVQVGAKMRDVQGVEPLDFPPRQGIAMHCGSQADFGYVPYSLSTESDRDLFFRGRRDCGQPILIQAQTNSLPHLCATLDLNGARQLERRAEGLEGGVRPGALILHLEDVTYKL